MTQWVVCLNGSGRLHENGVLAKLNTHFPANAVGMLKARENDMAIVWLIGKNETYAIPQEEITVIDVRKTGDKFDKKICNICHCLKSVGKFSRNQTNLHGIVRRPSCTDCRTDIDKRSPKRSQAKRMEKVRPAIGDSFKCPICQKRSIAGVTAKIVADHDHHTGNIRDFICDSCNTGLGRFKNGENYLMNAVNYLKEKDTLK